MKTKTFFRVGYLSASLAKNSNEKSPNTSSDYELYWEIKGDLN
jgi:hypothetical protein